MPGKCERRGRRPGNVLWNTNHAWTSITCRRPGILDVNQLHARTPKRDVLSSFLLSNDEFGHFLSFSAQGCSFVRGSPGSVHPVYPPYTPGYTASTGSRAHPPAGCAKGSYRQAACLDSCNNVLLPQVPGKLVSNLKCPAIGHVGRQ